MSELTREVFEAASCAWLQGGDVNSRGLEESIQANFGNSNKEVMKIFNDYGVEKILGMFHDFRYAGAAAFHPWVPRNGGRSN